MIRISDEILPILIELDRDELIVYLLINRYMAEDEDVPLDHVRKLGGLGIPEFFRALERLEKHAALELKVELAPDELESKHIVIRDSINEKIAPVSFREKEASLYIKNIEAYKNKNDNTSNQLGIQKKNDAHARDDSLSIAEQKITRHWKAALTKLHNQLVKDDANALVDYFADYQLQLYDQISLTKSWRKIQFGIARRLFRTHQHSLVTWKAAVKYFAKQEYWKDKLNSLGQVEKNIHQFLAKHSKKRSSETKVKKIS